MLNKPIVILISILMIITLIGCQRQEQETQDLPKLTVESSLPESVSEPEKSIPKLEVITENNDADCETEIVNNETKSETVITKTEKENQPKPTNKDIEKPVNSTPNAKTQENSTPDENKETIIQNTEESESTKESEIANPQQVEKLVAKYINEYRNEQGDTTAILLNGMTTVARYRANQLITNFAHANARNVCKELKYGKYIDLTVYGLPESDNYYEGYDREAICKGDWAGTAEQIARNIADGFRKSSKHWEYVGASEYRYMAIGIVYNQTDQTWYGCICVSMENYGG